MNFGLILEIALLIKAILFCIQSILELLLEDIGICQRESIILHKNMFIYSLVLYIVIHSLRFVNNPCVSDFIRIDDNISKLILSSNTEKWVNFEIVADI